jgi:hypothetical protein
VSENPIVLRGLGDVVALVPHLVGAQVNDSIVVVPVELRAAPVARVDLEHVAPSRMSVTEAVAELGIQIGAPITYRPQFGRLQGQRITGTALDDRAGHPQRADRRDRALRKAVARARRPSPWEGVASAA